MRIDLRRLRLSLRAWCAIACTAAVVAMGVAACGGPSSNPSDEGEAGSGDASFDATSRPDAAMDSSAAMESSIVLDSSAEAAPPGPDAQPDATATDATADAPALACTPGATQCWDNATVQTCTADGGWTAPVACVDQTCVAGQCAGQCSPRQTECVGNSLSYCDAGAWSSPTACTDQTCVGFSADASADSSPVRAGCRGTCEPGQMACDGGQPLSCATTGDWTGLGDACAGSTPVCSAGACIVCLPGSSRCNGLQPQTCDGTGASWQNQGPACTAPTPYCAGGSCYATPFPPSCEPGGPGMTDCGATAESCCASPLVTGGTFDRTYGADAGADPATVSSFRLDKYEITVGRFRQYVSYLVNGGSPPADGSGKHTHLNAGAGLVISDTPSADGGPTYEYGWLASWWNQFVPTGPSAESVWNDNLTCAQYPGASQYASWTSSVGPNEDLPVGCLTWPEAYAFCIWDGGFLPSLAEWRYATAGGSEQREYPWGSQDPGTASQYAIYQCLFPTGQSDACVGVANFAPVGHTTLGAGRWGQLDLVGNVGEWSLDFNNATTFYSPCLDCVDLSSTGYRFQDGSSALQVLATLPYAGGVYVDPGGGDPEYGARCARAP
jgi:formylglycine-generating enzyme required for sulfatase activity